MQENIIKNKTEIIEIINNNPKNKNQSQIAVAIIIAGVLIAGAILLKGNNTPVAKDISPSKVTAEDRTLGNAKAKVTFILYEDFQCPFCGAVSGLTSGTDAIKYLEEASPNWTPFMTGVNEYVKNGSVRFVYRDWAFLGPESVKSAEAARCAGDQEKFWEYHDYLYAHQNGENEGAFSDPNLKSFAKGLGLNATSFDTCLDSGKYTKIVENSKEEGLNAGVKGTPKGFIMKDGKVFATIDGAEPWSSVKTKLDGALK